MIYHTKPAIINYILNPGRPQVPSTGNHAPRHHALPQGPLPPGPVPPGPAPPPPPPPLPPMPRCDVYIPDPAEDEAVTETEREAYEEWVIDTLEPILKV
jgi:hypothetical protein